ncbi:MAG: hypothetical protein HFF56_04400 [Lawsonibacter sp.]|nr:hypothetical protein [Lawsonibacter sp.]
MVRNNKKVVLTIPGSELAEAVMNCGSSTGRNTDKVKKFDIEMASLPGGSIQIPAHSNEAEKALFAWNGYAKIAPARQE